MYDYEFIIASVNLFLNFLIAVGIIFAFFQVTLARKALRAEVFLKLYDEWKNIEIYNSVRYIDQLRREWKAHPYTEWRRLAQEWVATHARRNPNAKTATERTLAKEWIMRRTASQFLSKMGSIVEAGFISENDFFGVNPEVGRQLVVLIPIEQAIEEYWKELDEEPLAEWDRPVPKWEFNVLWKRYQKWYYRNKKKLNLESVTSLSTK